MNVFDDFSNRVGAVTRALLAEAGNPPGAKLAAIVVEPPREAAHGDIATNAAMVLAKPMQMRPRDLAERIAAALAEDPDVETVAVAGPGFINLRLTRAYWHGALRALIAAGETFGESSAGGGQRVNVEYVSANPTGPLHIGHCRGAVVGDAIANLLQATGHDVVREYYVNDAGSQIDTLTRSAYLRYLEALGEDIGDIPEGYYPGDYLKAVGEALMQRHGAALRSDDEHVWWGPVRETAIDMMLESIRSDLDLLSIRHDLFFSEASLQSGETDRIADALDWLSARGLIYQGRLPPPKGQLPQDWEDREQTLFRSTDFGDDVDRAIRKSDGGYTYFASDIAYHFDKLQRGFTHMIDVLGADHGGYVKRMQAVVQALSNGEGTLDIRLCQLVRLFREGVPIKMSKRSGEFVTLREVVDEVGPDPIRFMMVYRKSEAPLDFDFQNVTEQSKDNPVFYVQYAHARTHSVLRVAAETMPDIAASGAGQAHDVPLEYLVDDGEIALIRHLSTYPRIVAAAAEAREPHRLAFYLHDLAAAFHAHWNRGKELPQLRFTNTEDPDATRARLALVGAIKLVLASGLAILGVSAPEEMR
ncbi:MAG: arginine--tRNA ligase [Alphaproteobacteria bacterium]